MSQSNKYEDFFSRVKALSSKDKIQLKRAVGKTLENADVLTLLAFYKAYPEKWNEEILSAYFFTAGIYCSMGSSKVLFQERLRDIYQDKDVSDSTKQSIIRLLSMDWEESGKMTHYLMRFVRILEREGKAFNTEALLKDLIYWNDEKKISKRTWARCIAGA